MKIAYKIWLDSNGKAFGEGPYEMLRLVHQTGSLRQAAARMNMSYRKAWLLLRAMEERLGFAVLKRRVGGVAGGGSQLTQRAREFLDKYEAFRSEADDALQTIYRKFFSN